MGTPSVPQTLWTERAGILAVASHINRLGLIWREQPSVDVGIDGQIELVDGEGRATGRIVAVQVKSGGSYLRDGGEDWVFHPEEKHRLYWEIFPLPVLLMLHSPADGITYWVDARQVLRSASSSAIRVPKRNQLHITTAAGLFQTAGTAPGTFLTIPEALHVLCTVRTTSPTFDLTYFDLFANGLTNIGRTIYFGMDLAVEVAEAKLPESAEWMSLASDAHEFLFGFLLFLVEQNLANVDVSACLVDWDTRGLLPQTIAPLTSRGRALVASIQELQARYQTEGRLDVPNGLAVAQEDFVKMEFTPSHHHRIPLITAFQQLVRAKSSEPAS